MSWVTTLKDDRNAPSMSHANAPLIPTGRLRLAMLIVDEGWSCARAAERFQVSVSTAYKWSRRYRAGQPMVDRPSAPATSPNRTPRRTERRILGLRYTRQWGPARIAYHLGLNLTGGAPGASAVPDAQSGVPGSGNRVAGAPRVGPQLRLRRPR